MKRLERLTETQSLTAAQARRKANNWLFRRVGSQGCVLDVDEITYDAPSGRWRLPVKLAYPTGVVFGPLAEIYVDAMTGEVVDSPNEEELRKRANKYARTHRLERKAALIAFCQSPFSLAARTGMIGVYEEPGDQEKRRDPR
jgi:hypothetical protein